MQALLFKQMTGPAIGKAREQGLPEMAATLDVGGSAATNAVHVLRRNS